MGEILIGRWDCSSCDTVGIMGDLYSCSNCGASRPEDVKFYLPEDAPVVKDSAGIASAKAGPDWKCEYCGSWISATLDDCDRCGGGEEVTAEKQKTTTYTHDSQIPRTPEEPRKNPGRTPEVGRERLTQLPAVRRRFRDWKTPLIALASVALLGVGGYLLLRSSDAEVQVTSHSWQRTQHIEQYQTLARDGWDHPSDAFSIRTERKIHHYNRVLDHYETRHRTEYYRVQEGTKTETYTERVAAGTERYISGYSTRNLGNGRFERTPRYSTRTRYRTVTRTRQVPRYVQKSRQVPYQEAIYRQEPEYRTYYHYNINRWQRVNPRIARGTNDTDPEWPSTELETYASLQPGNYRLGAREELYTLHLRTTDPEDVATYTTTLPLNRWQSLEDGQTLIIRTRLGQVEQVFTLEEYENQ